MNTAEQNHRLDKIAFWVIAAGFLIRVFYALWTTITPVAGDQGVNHIFALHLLGGGSLFEFSSERPPLYPVFCFACYLFAGKSAFTAVFLVQAALSAVTNLLFYKVGKRLFGPLAGLISACMLSFYPDLILYNILFYCEPLTIFCMSAATIFLIKRPGVKNTVLTAFFWALASLTRASAVFCIPGIFAIYLLAPKERFLKKLAHPLLFSVVFFAVISPWTIGNYAVHKRFVLLGDHGGLNFYASNNPVAGRDFVMPTFLRLKQGPSADRDYYREGIAFICRYPGACLKIQAQDISQWFSFQYDRFLTQYITAHQPTQQQDKNKVYLEGQKNVMVEQAANPRMNLFETVTAGFARGLNTVVFAFFALALALLFPYKNRQSLLLLPTLSYAVLLIGLFYVQIRYRTQVMPYIMLYAGYGMAKVPELLKGKLKLTVTQILVLLLLLLLLTVNFTYLAFCLEQAPRTVYTAW